MAECAAASATFTSAVSLFIICKDLISSISSGIDQVKQNNTKAVNCSMKAKFLANLTNICETKYTKCLTWLDHISQDELAIKLHELYQELIRES